MVEAAKGLVPVLVDCSQGSAHPDLKKKFGIKGFPTVLFTDYQGKEVARLNGRDPASVKAQFEDVVAKHSVKLFMDQDLPAGKSAAKEQQKLLAAVYMDEDPRSAAKNDALKAYLLHEEMAEVRGKLHWIRRPLEDEDGKKTDEAKEVGASKSPTLILIDPAAEGDGVIKKITSYRSLKKTLEKLIEKAED